MPVPSAGHAGRLRSSLRALRTTRTLVYCALLLALEVVLNLFVSIQIGPTLRVTFGFLCTAATAYLFGPVPAIANAVLADLLGFALRPTGPYFPGFTLSAAVGAVVYSLLLYERPCTLARAALAKAIVDIAVNLLLNTLWLDLLYGKAFFVILPARALKNLAQYPVDVALLYFGWKWLQSHRRRLGL